jgi:upstream activation factor subunit UAF30
LQRHDSEFHSEKQSLLSEAYGTNRFVDLDALRDVRTKRGVPHRLQFFHTPKIEGEFMATKAAAKKPAAKKAPAKKAAAKKAPAKKAAVKKAAPAKKAAVKKAAPAKKAAAKKAAAPKVKRKPNAAFMKAMTPSAILAAVIGATPAPRTEVTKKIWEYIKKNKLQDAVNRRMINADEKLKALFGKAQVSMFDMAKIINAHLK